jgi:hypothetical protein
MKQPWAGGGSKELENIPQTPVNANLHTTKCLLQQQRFPPLSSLLQLAIEFLRKSYQA